MAHSNRVRMSKLTLGLLAVLATAPAFAQSTSAGVGGRVLGAHGKPVAGAEVTITHVESGTVNRAVTDTDGRYNARGLRVGGPYIISTTKSGEGSISQDNVFLGLDKVSEVDLALAGGDVTTLEAVRAVATTTSDVFSADKMGSGTSVYREQLRALPSIQRNLQDYARLDPRVSQSDKSRGEISAAGQNSRYNTITIDGVNTSDTFGLEANTLPTIKQPISIDAIDAVHINVSNYDVTQKGYTGANINAVTKSGTNEFHGTATYVYRDNEMFGDDPDGNPFRGFNDEKTYGATLGGPIIKDRLFFFAAYEKLTRSENAPDFGPLGSGAATEVNISPAQIDTVRNTAQSVYGIEIGTDVVPDGVETTVEDSLFKLDWNINDSHRASLRWNKTEQADLIVPGMSTTRLSLSSDWFSQGKTFESWVGQWFADWSDKFSTEVKISQRDYESVPSNFSTMPTVNFTVVNPNRANPALRQNNTLLFGTDQFRHANVLRTETFNAYAAGTLFLGDHTLKFGADYDSNDVYNLFMNDAFGVYTFACVNSSATFTYTLGAVNCATSPLDTVNAAILENYSRGRYTGFSQRRSSTGVIDDAAAEFTLDNLGVFAQDTWAVNSNLTITAGLRYDVPMIDDRPLQNTTVALAPVYGAGVGGSQTGGFGYDNTVTIDGNGLLQPRIGFNYNFDSERPVQLRGGVGLFQGAAASVWLANPFTNNGLSIRVFNCSGTTGSNPCPVNNPALGYNPDPNQQPVFGAGTAVADVDILDPDLEQPSIWKANLALDAELPFWGLVAQAELLLTDVNKAIAYEHLNLGNPTRLGSDGRSLYWNAAGYNAASWQASGATVSGAGVEARALRNRAFNEVLLAKPTDKGRAQVLTLGLSRPMIHDWAASVAYTYTNATEVSPLTSSRGISNWDGRSVFNPNEEISGRANYEIGNRFSASFNWRHAFFGNYNSSVGVFYEGREGRPYSWTYNNDLNGDKIDGNDLMYIPTAFGSGEVVFRGGAAEEARFWDIVNSNPDLRSAVGGVVERNSGTNPWVNTFDVRISQEFPGFFKEHKAVLTLDLLNVGNMIDKDWGQVEEITFAGGNSTLITGNTVRGGFTRSFVNYNGVDAQGRYIYSLNPNVEGFSRRDNFGQSRWAAQVTFRYEF